MTRACFCRYTFPMPRPKKPPGEGRTILLQVRLTAEEKQLIEAAASASSLDVSAWVRMEILARSRQVVEAKPAGAPKDGKTRGGSGRLHKKQDEKRDG